MTFQITAFRSSRDSLYSHSQIASACLAPWEGLEGLHGGASRVGGSRGRAKGPECVSLPAPLTRAGDAARLKRARVFKVKVGKLLR